VNGDIVMVTPTALFPTMTTTPDETEPTTATTFPPTTD